MTRPIDIGIRFPTEAEQRRRRAAEHRARTVTERVAVLDDLWRAAWELARAGGRETPYSAHREREEQLAKDCWRALVRNG